MKYFNTFNNYNINEKIKLTGKISEYSKTIFETAANYYTKELLGQEKLDMTLAFGKVSKNSFGGVDLKSGINAVENGKFKIVLDIKTGLQFQLVAIAHEITHVKQIFKKELSISDDGFIIWLGEKFIHVSDYNDIVNRYDHEKYKSLPWEVEAYSNQKTLKDKFIKSEELLSLRNHSATMSMFIDCLS